MPISVRNLLNSFSEYGYFLLLFSLNRTDFPSRRISPPVGYSRALIILKSVLFPLPLGPMITTTWPFFTDKSTPLITSIPEKDFLMLASCNIPFFTPHFQIIHQDCQWIM